MMDASERSTLKLRALLQWLARAELVRGGKQMAALLHVLATFEFDEFRGAKLAEVARLLGTKQANASNLLKQFERHGFLERRLRGRDVVRRLRLPEGAEGLLQELVDQRPALTTKSRSTKPNANAARTEGATSRRKGTADTRGSRDREETQETAKAQQMAEDFEEREGIAAAIERMGLGSNEGRPEVQRKRRSSLGSRKRRTGAFATFGDEEFGMASEVKEDD